MSEKERPEPQVRVVDRRWWAQDEQSGAADDSGARKPTVVEDLERRLADVTAQLQAVAVEQQRAQEEFEQIRVRMRREAAREMERGRRAMLVELLEVIDNLDRALAAGGPDVAAAEPLTRGIALVRDQFLGKLASFGVSRVPTLNEPFDAARHEAVSTAPVTDPERHDTVVAVVKEGYAINDDILRPASVVVGRRA